MPISFYLFVNPNSRQSLSIPFSLFMSILPISSYISFYPLPIHLYFFIPLCQSRLMPISFYLFVNPNSRLSLTIPFSLFLSILPISSYNCFYLLPIHLYFFIPLCQSKLMPISFYLFVNPNSRLSLSIPFSLSLSILCISNYICFHFLSIHLNFFIKGFPIGVI